MLWSPNTQLLYPFENQANDYSGNARHGTLGGTPPCTYATRPNAGRCLYFPGTGYVTTPSFGLSGAVVVFACRIRCKFNATRQPILGGGVVSGTVGFIQCLRDEGTDDLYWRHADGTGGAWGGIADYFSSPFDDVWLNLLVLCDYSGRQLYFFRNGEHFGSVAMGGTPIFPSSASEKHLGDFEGVSHVYILTEGYLQNVQLWTLATMPPIAQLTANANRLMLGMNPIW
jgi:hypothetical protein